MMKRNFRGGRRISRNDSSNNQKVKPPFPNLAAFNITAIILSFFGYDYEVKELMKTMCKNTRAYYLGHKDILKGFVTGWDPERLL